MEGEGDEVRRARTDGAGWEGDAILAWWEHWVRGRGGGGGLARVHIQRTLLVLVLVLVRWCAGEVRRVGRW